MSDSDFELPSNDMEAFRNTLRSSKHIIAVAGAGLSAASGEDLFRVRLSGATCHVSSFVQVSGPFEAQVVYGESTTRSSLLRLKPSTRTHQGFGSFTIIVEKSTFTSICCALIPYL
jgi:hypothetical protein